MKECIYMIDLIMYKVKEKLMTKKCAYIFNCSPPLQILRSKFDEFKRKVEAGTERFNRCERQAKYLIEDRGSHTDEVIDRQDKVRLVND